MDHSSWQLLGRFWRDWMRPHWRRMLVALGLMIFVGVATSAYPLLVREAFDRFEAKDTSALWAIPLLVIAATFIRGLALYYQVVVTNTVVLRVVTNLQQAVFSHLLHADYARITAEPVGVLMSRTTSDAGRINGTVSRLMTNVVRDSLSIVALVGTMIYMDWLLSLIVLVIYPLAAVPIVLVGRRMRQITREAQVHNAELTAMLNESFSGARLIRTYGLQDYEQRRVNAKLDGQRHYTLLATTQRARLEPTLEALGGVAVAGVIAFGGWRVASGTGSVADFTGFVTALLMAAQPVRAVGTLNAILQQGLAAMERVFGLLDEPRRIQDAPDARDLSVTQGAVVFQDVSFAYGEAAPAVHGLSFQVPARATVALVGPSGAGKSTVFNLITRLFDVQDGVVSIDGQDIRQVSLDSLRQALALVSQDVFLFNDTIRANLLNGCRTGADDLTEDRLWEALEAAAAADFVRAQPSGLDTLVGDRGERLSGGQRQRIALARAILRDAPILLLDEATSALDAESERVVQDALDRLSADRTTLVIAHRLATVRQADLILVFDRGRVVEQGTHSDLLAAGGLYAHLCQLQFRDVEA